MTRTNRGYAAIRFQGLVDQESLAAFESEYTRDEEVVQALEDSRTDPKGGPLD